MTALTHTRYICT